MRQVVDWLLGLALLAVVLFQSELAVALALLFALLLVLSPKARRDWLVRHARMVILAAFGLSFALTAASAIFVVVIPISPVRAIGIDRYHLLSIVNVGPPKTSSYIPIRPFTMQLELEVRWPHSPFETFMSSRGQLHPSGFWIQSSMVPVVPSFIILVLPAVLFWFVRARKAGTGKCRSCEYDLTGNTSGVCPECGTSIDASATNS